MTDYTSTVADLLHASQQAHQRYHQHLDRMVVSPGGQPVFTPGNASEAKTALKEAASLRAQAQAIDPAHESPAWDDEPGTFSHGDLMLFYLKELAK